MGTIGGVMTARRDKEAGLIRALETSERGKDPTVSVRGSAVLGVAGGLRAESALADGARWSVAVSGVIDRVGRVSEPLDPAAAIAKLFDEGDPVQAAAAVLGDFACIATDGERLIAFRDHMGTEALFGGHTADAACVMSEPKQVVSVLERRRRADVDALVSTFFSQWLPEDDVPSVIEGSVRIPRGFVSELGFGGLRRLGRVWDPTNVLGTSSLSLDDSIQRVWELVVEAVGRAVEGPTAVSLSGGIDSTLIAATLAAIPAERIGAVSAVYPASPSVDESAFIAATVEQLGLKSAVYEPTSPRLSDLERWVDRFDGPTHGLAIGAMEDMNEEAGRLGYRTLLSGEMGELVYDLREHAIGKMLLSGRLRSVATNLSQLRRRGVEWTSLLRMVGATITPTPLALRYAARRPGDPPVHWLDPDFMPGLNHRWDLERRPSRRWSDIQLFFAMGPSYPGLEISSIIDDYTGIRTRRPLVDRELWEFFLTLPAEIKFPDAWTKSLVRHVLDGRAPDSVVWRADKTVFEEDSRRNAEYPRLREILGDGFELPGVHYEVLRTRLDEEAMGSFELAMVRSLASIHTFIRMTS